MTTTLPPWRTKARPHPDIIQGRFNTAVFAADLARVVAGDAPYDYVEPARFFEKTYLTQGLKELMGSVLRRLAGRPASEPVTDILTSFGGGKTHTLMALYHLAKGGNKALGWTGVKELLEDAGLTEMPEARVAVLVGTQLDPLKGEGRQGEPTRKTPWGELAWQLGGAEAYALVREHDEQRVPPPEDALIKLISGERPALILADEVMEYVRKARAVPIHDSSLATQTIGFFRYLTGAVSATSRCALVATLPASTLEIGKENEEDFRRLKMMLQRVERTRQLTEGEEIYEIVRRRLFDDTGSVQLHRQVAGAFVDYYRRNENVFPQWAAGKAYASKIERAYPFHPEFLDLLNERWASIPGFQKTRGVLRMLGLLIGALYKEDPNALILPASAKLSFRDFRSEVLRQADADSQFHSVIESDIAGTGARAQKIDAEGSDSYQREHIAEGVATAIFFYSFGGTGGISTATLPQLRLATLRPDLAPAFVPDVLGSLGKRLYYLEVEAEQYRFTVTPNLNAIRVDQEANVDPHQVDDLVKEEVIKQVRGNRFRVIPYPQEIRDVPDQPMLALVVLPHILTWAADSRPATEARIREILTGGTTFRSCKNSLAFLVAERAGPLRSEARTLLALEAVDRLYGRTGKLAEGQKRDLERLLGDSRKRLPQAVWNAYRFVVTAKEGDSLHVFDLGPQLQRQGRTLADAVWEHLVDKERLAPRLGPGQLTSDALRLWPQNQELVNVRTLKEAFAQYTYLPMIPSGSVLQTTISQGIQQGLFGYGIGKGEEKKFDVVHFKVPAPPEAIELTESAWLLRPKLASELTEKPPEPIAPPIGPSGPGPSVGPQPLGPGPAPVSGLYHRLEVESDLDWQKWADFYDGVVKPLVQSGADVKLHVKLTADSEKGVSQNTVDLVIRENVAQYGLSAEVRPAADTP